MEYLNIVVVVLLVGVIFLVLFRGRRQEGGQEILLLQQHMNDLRAETRQGLTQLTEQVNQRLHSHQELLLRSHETLGSRLDNAAKVVGDVRDRLRGLHEATNRVVEISKDIASLQDILKPPKLRGGMAESFLGDLLRQILPQDHYSFQYRFKNNEAVDAVIKLGERLVPVDAKFPLEDFKRLIEAGDAEGQRRARKEFIANVKKEVDSIATKYIRPEEGTFDFALMYIPAENVYYETIVKDESIEESIAEYAMKKKVIPVSPNTFYSYLQTILLGLRGFKIEERVEGVMRSLEGLKGEFGRFEEDFVTMGKHLRNCVSKYDDAYKDLEKFNGMLDRIETLGEGEGPKKAEAKKGPQAHSEHSESGGLF